MKRRTIRIIILLATLSIVGIVFTQIYWISSALDLKNKEFHDRVNIALRNVGKEISKANKDSAFIPHQVEQVTSNYYIVRTNDTLHPYYLENLLKTEFEQRNLKMDFEYGIYDCFTDSIVYGGYVGFGDGESIKDNNAEKLLKWDHNSHYFGVYFPDRSGYVFEQMGFWTYSSIILLIVIIFFGYTMSVILKQKKLSEIKTDFINNLTHEFKTPISTISISSEVLMRPETRLNPEKTTRYARIILEENNRLKNQVEKVLKMASFDTEDLPLTRTEVDVHKTIINCVNNIQLTLEEKNGKISMEFKADNCIISADQVHFTNIIYNLLDNAIKYSKEIPEIYINTENVARGMVIKIGDHGIGIKKDAQKHIFKKFYRVSTGNIHDVKGFGLGLYYVKAMIEAHKGKISFSSEPGSGTVFNIFFPFKK